MRLSNPLQSLAQAFYSACHKDLSDIEFERIDYGPGVRDKSIKLCNLPRVKDKRRPMDHDVEVAAMFPQTWCSTALGFGGIGGSSMSLAYTTIITNHMHTEFCVYFDGRFAYKVSKPNDEFWHDFNARNMKEVRASALYRRENEVKDIE